MSEKSQKKLLVVTELVVSGTQSNALSEYHAIQSLCNFVIIWLSPKLCSAAAHAVADPGFSWGGSANSQIECANLFFAENYIKMKEFEPLVYRDKGTPPKKGGGPVLLLQNYPHPLSLRGRGPYHFPTPLNTWAPRTWPPFPFYFFSLNKKETQNWN